MIYCVCTITALKRFANIKQINDNTYKLKSGNVVKKDEYTIFSLPNYEFVESLSKKDFYDKYELELCNLELNFTLKDGLNKKVLTGLLCYSKEDK